MQESTAKAKKKTRYAICSIDDRDNVRWWTEGWNDTTKTQYTKQAARKAIAEYYDRPGSDADALIIPYDYAACMDDHADPEAVDWDNFDGRCDCWSRDDDDDDEEEEEEERLPCGECDGCWAWVQRQFADDIRSHAVNP